jgi:hypothetical protein
MSFDVLVMLLASVSNLLLEEVSSKMKKNGEWRGTIAMVQRNEWMNDPVVALFHSSSITRLFCGASREVCGPRRRSACRLAVRRLSWGGFDGLCNLRLITRLWSTHLLDGRCIVQGTSCVLIDFCVTDCGRGRLARSKQGLWPHTTHKKKVNFRP